MVVELLLELLPPGPVLVPLCVAASPGPQSTIVCELLLGLPIGPGFEVDCVDDTLQFSRAGGASARPPLSIVVLELLSEVLPPGPTVVLWLCDVVPSASAAPAASIAAQVKTTNCFMTNS